MSTGTSSRSCHFFLAGHCKYGERCRFAHHPMGAERASSLEISAPSAPSAQVNNQASTPRDGRFGNKQCYFFKMGRCTKGENCHYSHELQDPQASDSNHKKEYNANATIKWVLMGGSTFVTCGAGLDVRHIVCGFESCFVTIKHASQHAKLHEIEELLTQQGIDTNLFYIVKKIYVNDEAEFKVISDSELGQTLATGLDGVEFHGKYLDITVDNGSVPNKMSSASERNVNTLTINWKLPTATMMAQYITTDGALDAVRRLNNTILGGRNIQAQLYRNASMPSDAPSASVKITGIPLSVTTTEVQNHFGAYLVRNSISSSSPVTLFDSRDVEKDLRRILEQKQGFEAFNMSAPIPNKFNAEARVRFRTWNDAKIAHDSLEGMALGSGYSPLRVWLPKPIQYVITIPLSQYLAQRRRWDSFPDDNHGAFVRISNNGIDKAFIRVEGEDKKAVGQLKVRVENLAAGETLDVKLWHGSFIGAQGQRVLEDIGAQSGAYVRGDWKSKRLKLYADDNAKQVAVNLIKAEIARLESLEWSEPINRRAVGFFLRQGLPILKEQLGEDAATLELLPEPRLIIRGGNEARQTVERLIMESRMGIESEAKSSEQATCPICFDELTSPVKLSCGHLYCAACLRHFLSSAADRRVFPLVCSGDQDKCEVPITIPIIRRHLLPQQFNQLVQAAVTTHIEKQPAKFRYCRTPDCPQVYRCEGDSTVLACPSCFATVCTGCHKEPHEGMTCREREIMDNPEAQERLNKAWAEAEGVKPCPSCRVLIQKAEGCNHVECHCGAHICWICPAIFPQADDVYAHLRAVHGGIHDDRVQHERLQQERVDLAFAQRLQAEENDMPQVANFAEEWQQQRREERETWAREIREMEERQRRASEDQSAEEGWRVAGNRRATAERRASEDPGSSSKGRRVPGDLHAANGRWFPEDRRAVDGWRASEGGRVPGDLHVANGRWSPGDRRGAWGRRGPEGQKAPEGQRTAEDQRIVQGQRAQDNWSVGK